MRDLVATGKKEMVRWSVDEETEIPIELESMVPGTQARKRKGKNVVLSSSGSGSSSAPSGSEDANREHVHGSGSGTDSYSDREPASPGTHHINADQVMDAENIGEGVTSHPANSFLDSSIFQYYTYAGHPSEFEQLMTIDDFGASYFGLTGLDGWTLQRDDDNEQPDNSVLS